MMMPNPTMQREMTQARRARHSGGIRHEVQSTRQASRLGSLRVQVGHALIGAGSWLSGERVEAARPSAHRPA